MKDLSDKADSKFKNKHVSPFVGHEGVGSRVELAKSSRFLILRESTSSQLLTLLPLALLSFYPPWLIYFYEERIKGGLVTKILLGAVSVFCFVFFVKFLLQMLWKRRIEFDSNRQEIRFFEGRIQKENPKALPFSEVQSLEVVKTIYVSKGQWDNFTIVLTDKSGARQDLCTSNREAEAASICSQLQALVVRNS